MKNETKSRQNHRPPDPDREQPGGQMTPGRPLELLMAYWPGVVFSQRPDFSFSFRGPKIEDLTGISPEEWARQPHRFWEIVHEADADQLRKQITRMAQGQSTATTAYRIRHILTGAISHIVEHREARFDEGGVLLGYQGVWLDKTREVLAEKRLESASAQAGVATLIRGMTHDLRNALGSVTAAVELLVFEKEANPPEPMLPILKRGTDRALHLLDQISEMNRARPGARQLAELSQAVTEAAGLIGKALPARFKVTLEPSQTPLPAFLDTVGMRQVLLGLASALTQSNTGIREVIFAASTTNRTPDTNYTAGQFPSLPCLCLSVKQATAIIPASHLPCLFNPGFFTESLAGDQAWAFYQARLFADIHGGAVSVESSATAGTTVCIWLPRADAERLGEEPARGENKHRLLIVGREDPETKAVAETLRTAGYYVVATTSEVRALELLCSEGDSVGAVVILADVEDTALLKTVAEVRRYAPSARTGIRLLHGEAGDVDFSLLEDADFVVSGATGADILLEKLRKTLHT